MKKIIVYTDGGARGNPGPAGVGVVFYDDKGTILSRHKKYIGEATNNQAEYNAILYALESAIEKGYKELEIFLDSELVVRQLNGHYKIKNPQIRELVFEVRKKETQLGSIIYHHVLREKNEEADRLVNEAIDEAR